jgi:phosphatidylglycerol:prolipoprotein diacylglycerol transferase
MIVTYIHWDVDPELFSGAGFMLRYYSLLFAGGIVAGYLLLKRIFLHDGLSLGRLDRLSVYLVVGILAGARLGHCFFYEPGYYLSHPLEVFLPWEGFPGTKGFHYTGFQGLASHGGAVGIILAVVLFCRKYKIPFLLIMDKLAPIVPLTGAFIRIGNLFNSEIIGRPSDLPFAFIFDHVDLIPRHPAQLYEAGTYLAIFCFLYFFLRLKASSHRSGYLFGWLLVLLFTARFTLEFFKENQELFERHLPLDMGQLLSIPFVICGLVLLLRVRRSYVPNDLPLNGVR